ncbi:unnamed protein product [Allacma fusca]|uniref:Uncharacterized protein n=1 Tax=Allacma fusca TaxID=39272 RepID=A0A8J2LLF2_9HEXA|nr:unnamed protein product [Allacma fusca]
MQAYYSDIIRKSTLEPSSTDARFVDLIVTVQDDSVVDNRVFLFQSLEYSISWKNIRRVAEYVFTEDNHRIVPYSSVSRRYVKFCLLDDLRSANNVTKDDTDSFELIDALVKVNLHFKSQSKVIHSSSPDDLSEGFQTEFPTINICGNDSDHDNDSAEDDDDDNDSVEDDDDDNDSVEDDDDDNDSAADDEDSFDDSCSYTMCAETMDYYLYFLNPSGPCHSNLTDLRQNVQVNCELAEFSKSCKMEDLFQICIMNLRRILQPSSPFPATLQIWNIASKYSLGELEIQAVETMERFIFSVPHSEKEAIQLTVYTLHDLITEELDGNWKVTDTAGEVF